MRLRTLWLPIITLALAACGGGDGSEDDYELEKGPYLFVDRNSLGFNQEFGSGTWVGATTRNALYMENRGDKPLSITSVTKTAPNEFTVRLPQELADGQTLTLESRQTALIEVEFKPSRAQVYEGTLTIVSNAGNEPDKVIALSGKGVPPPENP